jgi:hypothetical protein
MPFLKWYACAHASDFGQEDEFLSRLEQDKNSDSKVICQCCYISRV